MKQVQTDNSYFLDKVKLRLNNLPDKKTILPLLNPGLKVELKDDCVVYTASLLFPNELVFMIY